MRTTRLFAVVTVIAIAVALGAAGSAGADPTAPRWAPAASAPVHPGVQTYTEGAQCTANFVFYDGTDVFIGQAGHCSSTGATTETNGCNTDVLPLGTPVEVGGAQYPGEVVYNSWVTMQAVGELNENVCLGNDFALVRIDPRDHARINPSVPFFGGPVGLDGATGALDTVYAYGNSGLRGGLELLSRKFGVSLGDSLDGWNHDVYTITPGIPGDSGGAYLGPDGGALGVLSTFNAVLANQVSDLSKAMAYMKQHAGFADVQMANGTEPFSPLL